MRKVKPPKAPRVRAPKARYRNTMPDLFSGEPITVKSTGYRGSHTPRAGRARTSAAEAAAARSRAIPVKASHHPVRLDRLPDATYRRPSYGKRLTPLSDRPNEMRPKARSRFDGGSSDERARARIAYERQRLETQAARRARPGNPRKRFDDNRPMDERLAEMNRAAAKYQPAYKVKGTAKRPASALRDPKAHPAKPRRAIQRDPQPAKAHPYFSRPPVGSGIGDQPPRKR